jgi:hypothetical protein
VTRESATSFCPAEELHDQVPIDTDHSHLVKFSGRADSNCDVVRFKLVEIVRKTQGFASKREGNTEEIVSKGEVRSECFGWMS